MANLKKKLVGASPSSNRLARLLIFALSDSEEIRALRETSKSTISDFAERSPEVRRFLAEINLLVSKTLCRERSIRFRHEKEIVEDLISSLSDSQKVQTESKVCLKSKKRSIKVQISSQ